MAITLVQLRAFLAVERAGSIKGAAADLVVTQPSVSGAIAALEREIGTKLVERRGRGVALTTAGQAFVPHASRSLGMLEEGREAALGATDPERQELRIAAVNTAGEYLMPPILRAFRTACPTAELSLAVSNRAGVFRRLERREADIAIGGSPPESGEYETQPFLTNEHLVIAAPDHPLSGRRGLYFKDLGEATWLMREPGSGTRTFVEGLLAARGLRPATMTIGSNGAIKESARAGLGISIQSCWALSFELASGLLTSLDLVDTIPDRRWQAVCLAEGPKRPLVRPFLSFLCNPAGLRAVEEFRVVPLNFCKR
jgi:DNA-binding transcriptional LysR family regulator